MIRKLNCSMFIASGALLLAQSGGPQTFGSAEEARDALVRAAKNSLDAVKTLFGPASAEIVRTGDEIEDKVALERFNHLAAEKIELESDPMGPDRLKLALGIVEWPFAVP